METNQLSADYNPLYTACALCPRNCRVNRNQGEPGFCGQTNQIKIAYAGLHNGEEPPISGEKGSGTVFFSGCTLQCFFCQNYQISKTFVGHRVASDELVQILLRLQGKGAANINFVTGTHFTPGIIRVVAEARKQGLSIPIVWNSSGFDKISTLELLAGTVDIFLPDIKTLDKDTAERIFLKVSYPRYAQESLEFLAERVPLSFKGDIMQTGMIVRHLVLPGELDSTYQVLSWYRQHLEGKALLSLMFQYTPNSFSPDNGIIPPPFARPLQESEYEAVYDFLNKLGIEDGFIQEFNAEDTSWSPDFTRSNPFSSAFSVPVWSNGSFFE